MPQSCSGVDAAEAAAAFPWQRAVSISSSDNGVVT